MKKQILFLLLSLLILSNGSASAFNEKITHRDLTVRALKVSNIKDYLVNYLGYSSGEYSIISGLDWKGWPRDYTVLKWLQEGAKDEDAPQTVGISCRASNHFHNPIHSGDWTESKMSDSLEVDGYCGASNRYSDVTWATGYTYPPPDGSKITPNGQSFGWDNARNYYYDALTSTNPISGVLTRAGQFARTLRSLGMISHLL